MSTHDSTPTAIDLGADDDVIVCRCEEVRLGDLLRGIADGYGAPEMLKRATRISMGACQGRVCRPMYRAFWQSHQSASPASASTASVGYVGVDKDSRASLPVNQVLDLPGSRPPIRPVRVSDLADLETPEETPTPSQGNS